MLVLRCCRRSFAAAPGPKFACPRWAELGAAALAMGLCSAGTGDEQIATQLSAVLGGLPAGAPPRVLRPDAARSLVYRLALEGGPALASLPVGGAVLWALADASALGRLMSAYAQHAAVATEPRPLRLIVPLDVLPGCSTASGILDLRSRPLLQDKWKPMVRKVEFSSQALELVQSGAAAPTTTSRTLMIATVSASAPFVPPCVWSIADPLFTISKGRGIRVDCPMHEFMQVRRSLVSALVTRPLLWTDPSRSPGSALTAARVFFTGHFPRVRSPISRWP